MAGPSGNESATLTGATMTLGSLGASAAAFVVSGLDETSGDTGVLTLSEGGSTVMVGVTGDGTTYDKDLAEAVKKFQKEHDLKVTGTLTPQMPARLAVTV